MKPENQRIAIAESLGWTFITWDARPLGKLAEIKNRLPGISQEVAG